MPDIGAELAGHPLSASRKRAASRYLLYLARRLGTTLGGIDPTPIQLHQCTSSRSRLKPALAYARAHFDLSTVVWIVSIASRTGSAIDCPTKPSWHGNLQQH